MRGKVILVRFSQVILVRNRVFLVPTGKVVCNGTLKSKNFATKYLLEDITFSSVYCGTRPRGPRADSRSSGNEEPLGMRHA